MTSTEPKDIPPLVLFDGVCNLCNQSVDFMITRERGDSLRFASLQSEIAQDILRQHQIDQLPDSFIFCTEGKFLFYSDAILAAVTHLQAPWNWLRFLKVLPTSWRDCAYRYIAKNRYAWFGKKQTCRVSTASERGKFLG